LGIEEAITVPLPRALLAPLRNCRVTVPEVVGVQVSVVGEPALRLYPEVGTLNGFASPELDPVPVVWG